MLHSSFESKVSQLHSHCTNVKSSTTILIQMVMQICICTDMQAAQQIGYPVLQHAEHQGTAETLCLVADVMCKAVGQRQCSLQTNF